MRLKTNFVLPHKSTNWAFIDGTLCGILIAYNVNWMLREYREMKVQKVLAEDEIDRKLHAVH